MSIRTHAPPPTTDTDQCRPVPRHGAEHHLSFSGCVAAKFGFQANYFQHFGWSREDQEVARTLDSNSDWRAYKFIEAVNRTGISSSDMDVGEGRDAKFEDACGC